MEFYATERKKELIHFAMDGTGEHYAKWNKPGSETQIPHDLTCKRTLKMKTDKEENRARGMGRRKRLRATRGEGEGVKGENKGK